MPGFFANTANETVPVWVAVLLVALTIAGNVGITLVNLRAERKRSWEERTQGRRAETYIDMLRYTDAVTRVLLALSTAKKATVELPPREEHLVLTARLTVFGSPAVFDLVGDWGSQLVVVNSHLDGGSLTQSEGGKSANELKAAWIRIRNQVVKELSPPGERRKPMPIPDHE